MFWGLNTFFGEVGGGEVGRREERRERERERERKKDLYEERERRR